MPTLCGEHVGCSRRIRHDRTSIPWIRHLRLRGMSSEMEHAPACKLEFETRMVMSVRASTLRSPQRGIGLFSGRSPEQRYAVSFEIIYLSS